MQTGCTSSQFICSERCNKTLKIKTPITFTVAVLNLNSLSCISEMLHEWPSVQTLTRLMLIQVDTVCETRWQDGSNEGSQYRKNSKIWDTSNNCHNCAKNRKVCCNIALMHPKEADVMANSIDPDQTASSEVV